MIITDETTLRQIIASEVEKALAKINTNNDIMISGKEAMGIIGIRNYRTFQNIVNSGGLTPRFPTGSTRPRFNMQEVIDYSKS